MYLNDKLPTADVKADPFTLPALIAWLRTKDAAKTYCYTDSGVCLIGQYFAHLGFRNVSLDDETWDAEGKPDAPLPDHFDDVANDYPMTFGAALLRAEKLLNK